MTTENGYTGHIYKPDRWGRAPAANVATITLAASSVSNDATIAEAMAALGYAWDATDGVFTKLAVDHSTGALKVYVSGGGSGGGAATVADGADVAEGATTDSAVITDTTGTVSGKLRGLVKWAFERMPASLGQKAKAASLPVVLASDQDALAVTGTFYQSTQPVSVAAPTTIYNGKKTVTTAGTRVTLASSQAVRSVVIKALVGNTGTIYVGDGSVASTTGFALSPGDTVSLDIANLATVNLDSSVNGEGVTYAATN